MMKLLTSLCILLMISVGLAGCYTKSCYQGDYKEPTAATSKTN